MKSIIIKSALAGLGIAVGCAIIVFAVLSLGFPGTLCGWCEQLGNYGFAVRYASLYYAYTDKIADLGRCADDSILAENDEYITEYCTLLVDHEEFNAYCELRDEEMAESQPLLGFSYRQYIYGAVSSAYYRQDSIDIAIGFAIEGIEPDFERTSYAEGASCSIQGFPVNNALGSLCLKVINAGDGDCAKSLLSVLSGVMPEGEVEEAYLQTLTNALEEL